MDDIDFTGFEDIINNNFYADDFDYMAKDANGNSAEYKQIEDNFFDNPSDFEGQDFI